MAVRPIGNSDLAKNRGKDLDEMKCREEEELNKIILNCEEHIDKSIRSYQQKGASLPYTFSIVDRVGGDDFGLTQNLNSDKKEKEIYHSLKEVYSKAGWIVGELIQKEERLGDDGPYHYRSFFMIETVESNVKRVAKEKEKSRKQEAEWEKKKQLEAEKIASYQAEKAENNKRYNAREYSWNGVVFGVVSGMLVNMLSCVVVRDISFIASVKNLVLFVVLGAAIGAVTGYVIGRNDPT